MTIELQGNLPAITGVGYALPELSNVTDIAGYRTARLFEARIHPHGESGPCALELAQRAGEMALAHSQVESTEINLLLLGTLTQPNKSDYLRQVANVLGIPHGKTFSYTFNQYGGLAGLQMAVEILRSDAVLSRPEYGTAKVLIVGVDTPSTLPDASCIPDVSLFGDGAGAAVVQPVPDTNMPRFVVSNRIGDVKLTPVGQLPESIKSYQEVIAVMNMLHQQNAYGVSMNALHMASVLVAGLAGTRDRFANNGSIDWDRLSHHIAVHTNHDDYKYGEAALEVPQNKSFDSLSYFNHSLLASNLMAIAILAHEQPGSFGYLKQERFLTSSTGLANCGAAGIISAKFPKVSAITKI